MQYRRSAVALAFLSALAGSAHADDAGGLVDELVVTAQRRAQDTVDVPIALTAYSGETLTRLRVQDMHDLSIFTPGLVVQDKSVADSRFVLRGIGSDDGSSYQEARVSVFQDGAPMSKSRGAFVELFDLERVEVSRGPQTTLYGRSALIGAVNLVQNKARFGEPDWSLRAEVGEYRAALLDVAGGLALSEDLAVRGAIRLRRRDGTVDNLLGGADFGSREALAGRLALAWAPSDRVRVDLILNHQDDEGSAQSFKSRTFNPSDPVTGARLGDTDPDHGAALAAAEGFAGGLGLERRVSSVTALVAWTLNDTTSLNLTSSYRSFESWQGLDFDGTGLPLLTVGDDARGEQQSHELRLNYEPSTDITFIGGVSLFRETGRQRTPFQIDERLVLALVTGALDRRNPDLRPQAYYTAPALQAALLRGVVGSAGGVLSPAQASAIAANLNPAHVETYEDHARHQGADLYGDLSWRPAPRIELSAGLRYGYIDKRSGLSSTSDSRSILAGVLGAIRQPAAARTALLGALARPGAATIPTSAAYPIPMFGLRAQPTAGGRRETDELIDRGAAWRLVGRYEVTPELNAYASYARGRRPELLAPTTPNAPGGPVAFDRLAAETVDSVEFGLKWRSADQALSLDAAVYAYDYRHFQTVVQNGAQFVSADAGRARSRGLELQGAWAMAPNAQAFATYSWSRARFGKGLYRGNHLGLSPDHALTVGLDLSTPAFGGEIQVLPTYAYVSRTFFTDDNGDPALAANAFVAPLDFRASQPGYATLDLRVGYTPDAGRWSAGIYGANLFNTSYVKEAGNSGETFGLPTYVAGNPRMVGVWLAVRR